MLHPLAWPHCAVELGAALQRIGCINHTMAEISPFLKLPHNASVLEVANAYAHLLPILRVQVP
jgi:hypothetical protein